MKKHIRILGLGEDDAGTSLRAAALRVCLSSSSDGPLLYGDRLQKDLSDLNKKTNRKIVTLDQIRNVTFSKDVREVSRQCSVMIEWYCALNPYLRSIESIMIV